MEAGAVGARVLGSSLPPGCRVAGRGANTRGPSPGHATDLLLVLTLSEVSPPGGFPSFPPPPTPPPQLLLKKCASEAKDEGHGLCSRGPGQR